MKILTQFDLINRFPPGASIIFCGNAPSLRDKNLGNWIDSHDVVIRVNRLPKRNFIDDVGTKTSILVCNPYVCESDLEPLLYDENLCVVCLFSLTRRGDEKAFYRWLNGNSVLFSYIPDIVATDENDHFESLSTGTYALNIFSRILKPKSVSVCGFTMFLENTNHHYWSNLVPRGIKAHDFIAEAKIFISLLNRLPQKIDLFITSDILWVALKAKAKIKRDFKEKIGATN